MRGTYLWGILLHLAQVTHETKCCCILVCHRARRLLARWPPPLLSVRSGTCVASLKRRKWLRNKSCPGDAVPGAGAPAVYLCWIDFQAPRLRRLGCAAPTCLPNPASAQHCSYRLAFGAFCERQDERAVRLNLWNQ